MVWYFASENKAKRKAILRVFFVKTTSGRRLGNKELDWVLVPYHFTKVTAKIHIVIIFK